MTGLVSNKQSQACGQYEWHILTMADGQHHVACLSSVATSVLPASQQCWDSCSQSGMLQVTECTSIGSTRPIGSQWHVCLCMCVCLCICAFVRLCVRMYVFVCVFVSVCLFMYMPVSMTV